MPKYLTHSVNCWTISSLTELVFPWIISEGMAETVKVSKCQDATMINFWGKRISCSIICTRLQRLRFVPTPNTEHDIPLLKFYKLYYNGIVYHYM
jgi:hypothetical protein